MKDKTKIFTLLFLRIVLSIVLILYALIFMVHYIKGDGLYNLWISLISCLAFFCFNVCFEKIQEYENEKQN